jgi:hypothetical protein
MKNENGKNEIKITIPCCNEEEATISYKTSDNLFPYEIFKMLSKRIGLSATLKQAADDGSIHIEKGGD